jgi:cobalt-zinc-cadmium efflux system outer membrane protein
MFAKFPPLRNFVVRSLPLTRVGIAVTAFALMVCAGAAWGQNGAPAMFRLPHLSEVAQGPFPPGASMPEVLPAGEQMLALAAAEALAAGNYPALQVAQGRLQAAQGRWLQGGLLPNPVIGYLGNEIGNEGQAGLQGGYVGQDIVTGGKLGLARAVASREIAAAEQRYVGARLEAIVAVRKSYFEALAADRTVRLARQLQEMTTKAVRASELLLEAGGTGASLLQSQIENESVGLMEAQAVNRHDAARRRLAALIGQQGAIMAPLEDRFVQPLPVLDWESSKARIQAESPQLAEARLAVDRARWAVQQAIAGRLPNVNVQAGVQYDNSTEDSVANVQVSLPLPVFDRNQGGIAAAQGELAAAQGALQQQELAVQQRLIDVLRDYLSARQRVEKYSSTILPAAQRSLDMMAKAYEAGELDYLQLLSAQRTFTTTNVAYFEDLKTAWQKWAEIDGLLMETLPDEAE